MAFQALNCPAVRQLLQAVEKDFNLVNLAEKYLGVPVQSPGPVIPLPVPVQSPGPVIPPPKKKKVPKEACCGKTAKGDPCKFAVKSDGLCGIHLRQRDQPSGKKTSSTVAKVPKKVKKVVPTHTHPADESDSTCGLCEDHGNVVVPELTKADFEAVEEEGQSIQDRLRAILAGADEDEEDEVPKAPKAPKAPLDSFDQMKAVLDLYDEPEDEEPEDEDPEEVSMTVKLARLLAEEDVEDEDDAEDLIQQMSDTPPSRAKVAAFAELLEEMES